MDNTQRRWYTFITKLIKHSALETENKQLKSLLERYYKVGCKCEEGNIIPCVLCQETAKYF